MLYFLGSHWLSYERDLDFLALFEHPFRAGRGSRVHIHPHILRLFQKSIDGSHEAAEQECRIIQVDKDKAIRSLLADRACDRVDGRLFEERLVAFKAETFLKERHQVRTTDEQALWISNGNWGWSRRRINRRFFFNYGFLSRRFWLCRHISNIFVHLIYRNGCGFTQRWMADGRRVNQTVHCVVRRQQTCGAVCRHGDHQDEGARRVIVQEINWPSELPG